MDNIIRLDNVQDYNLILGTETLVRREIGKTATEHIQIAVIKKAKELLLETEKSISEIAYDLAFNYPHHLSRSFKKIVGMTPNEFRIKAV